LEAIERTNLKFFQSEMTAEFYALKGMLLGQIGNIIILSYTLYDSNNDYIL